MKLDIGKSYIVYTTSDYISNKQIRILGYMKKLHNIEIL